MLIRAGISAGSGLGTYRDRGEMWSRFDPMRLATLEAFPIEPETVLDLYNLRRRCVIAAESNAAHHALVCAEAALATRGGRLVLCTQNVDSLHGRARAPYCICTASCSRPAAPPAPSASRGDTTS